MRRKTAKEITVFTGWLIPGKVISFFPLPAGEIAREISGSPLEEIDGSFTFRGGEAFLAGPGSGAKPCPYGCRCRRRRPGSRPAQARAGAPGRAPGATPGRGRRGAGGQGRGRGNLFQIKRSHLRPKKRRGSPAFGNAIGSRRRGERARSKHSSRGDCARGCRLVRPP